MTKKSSKNRDQCEDWEKDRKNHPTCFIDQYNIGGFTEQPCNGIPVVLFEDLTNNHNKSLISAQTVTQAPCRATLIIETGNQIIQRDLDPSIQPSLSGTTLNIQVENLRRVSILCQGNPAGNCSLFYGIQKTFSFCCPKGTEKDKNCGGTKKEKNQGTSFIDQHRFFSQVSQPCDGSTRVIFEDATSNHNKTVLNYAYSTLAPCQATLIFDTDHGTITRELPNFPGSKSFGIELEDVRRISVHCQGNPAGTCNLTFTGIKTFCISSGPEKGEKSDYDKNPI